MSCSCRAQGNHRGTKGWSACGGIERWPVTGVLAAIALLVPRAKKVDNCACIADREPRASGFRLVQNSSVPQSLVEVRWPV